MVADPPPTTAGEGRARFAEAGIVVLPLWRGIVVLPLWRRQISGSCLFSSMPKEDWGLFRVMLTRSSTSFVGPLPPYPATLFPFFSDTAFCRGESHTTTSLEFLLDGRANGELQSRARHWQAHFQRRTLVLWTLPRTANILSQRTDGERDPGSWQIRQRANGELCSSTTLASEREERADTNEVPAHFVCLMRALAVN